MRRRLQRSPGEGTNPTYVIRFRGLEKSHNSARKSIMQALMFRFASPFRVQKVSSVTAELYCPEGEHLDLVAERLTVFGEYFRRDHPTFKIELAKWEPQRTVIEQGIVVRGQTDGNLGTKGKKR